MLEGISRCSKQLIEIDIAVRIEGCSKRLILVGRNQQQRMGYLSKYCQYKNSRSTRVAHFFYILRAQRQQP